jgi:hypothetical protein
MLSYSHHKKEEIKNLSYDGLFLYFWKREVWGMHILAFILIFVVGAIAAACDGDFSGIAAIGKFVGGAILVIGMLWLFTQPVLLVIVIVLLVVIIACCSGTK